MALPEVRLIEEEKFPEKLRRLVARDAPKAAQLMMARGAVPLPPAILVACLYQISQVADEETGAECQATLRKMPPAIIRQVAAEPLLPVVLDWLSKTFRDRPELHETLIQNRATDEDTIVALARHGSEALCEAIARDQERMLRAPAIIEALYYNRNCRASTADRIIDFAARNGVDLSYMPGFEEVLAAIHGTTGAAPTSPADQAASADVDQAVRELNAETDRLIAGGEIDFQDTEAVEKKSESLSMRLSKLNVAQKVRMALLGNQMERSALIREPNKLVQRAVIRSPAVNDNEAMGYAKNRSLPDEIIAYIASNRQWTKSYQMKLSLVKNPKCPMANAMTFMRMLRSNDLRLLSRDKNVSPAIQKMSKMLLAGPVKA